MFFTPPHSVFLMDQDFPYGLFEFGSRKQYIMAAAPAFDAEIHPHPEYIPFVGPAGVGFLHPDDIPHFIIRIILHGHHLLSG